jgi:hypothetical protein
VGAGDSQIRLYPVSFTIPWYALLLLLALLGTDIIYRLETSYQLRLPQLDSDVIQHLSRGIPWVVWIPCWAVLSTSSGSRVLRSYYRLRRTVADRYGSKTRLRGSLQRADIPLSKAEQRAVRRRFWWLSVLYFVLALPVAVAAVAITSYVGVDGLLRLALPTVVLIATVVIIYVAPVVASRLGVR